MNLVNPAWIYTMNTKQDFHDEAGLARLRKETSHRRAPLNPDNLVNLVNPAWIYTIKHDEQD